MTKLTYIAVDDDDLRPEARFLPLSKIQFRHLKQKKVVGDIIVLHRPDGQAILRNSFTGLCIK